jgi:hypothetical protein
VKYSETPFGMLAAAVGWVEPDAVEYARRTREVEAAADIYDAKYGSRERSADYARALATAQLAGMTVAGTADDLTAALSRHAPWLIGSDDPDVTAGRQQLGEQLATMKARREP